ncbi:hypothetical protein P3S67_006923 [Capsicum chacoense]
MGKTLSYIPPSLKGDKLVVQLEEADIVEQEAYWSTALIGFSIMMMDIISSNFAMISDRDLVMQSGPYTYRNRLVILRNWEIDFEFNPECLNKLFLWIKFHSLPLGYWSAEALSKLASVVGKPMYTDKYTAAMERISYARVLVETDISHPLPNRVEISTPSGIIHQNLTYDSVPKFCVDCNLFGHNSDECQKKKKVETEEPQAQHP